VACPTGEKRPRYVLTEYNQITEIRSAHDCYFTDEETAACVDEAHKLGKRLCAHARARDSVTMCQYST
jgi:imidazolonepropionase-like amidohydrolase